MSQLALYVTREGSIGASLDTFVNLSTYAGQTVNAITVPAGYSSIKQLWLNVGPIGNATDNQGCTFTIRLQGSGLKYGPVDIVAGAWSHLLLSNSGDAMVTWANVVPVDIALNPQGEIWVKAAQDGAAEVGSPEAAVTLAFTKQGAGTKWYIARDMNVAGANNTVYAVTHCVDDTAAGRIRVPAGVTRLTGFFGACGGIVADATGGTMSIRLKGTGLRDGDVVIPIGGYGVQGTTTAVDGCLVPAVYVPMDLALVSGGEIAAEAIFAGTDVTTPDVAFSVELSV